MNWRWPIVIGALAVGFWALYTIAFMNDDGASFGAAALESASILGAAVALGGIVVGLITWAGRGGK